MWKLNCFHIGDVVSLSDDVPKALGTVLSLAGYLIYNSTK
jgi:hypothetical protein